MSEHKESLSEKIGNLEMDRFVELKAQNHSFTEISDLLKKEFPEKAYHFDTKGKIAGLIWHHKQEFMTGVTAYLIVHAPVPKLGKSASCAESKFKKKEKPRSERERDDAIVKGLVEWDPHSLSFKHPYAYAAMQFNKDRRLGERVANKDDIAERIRQVGGLGMFLRIANAPQVDRVVERIVSRLNKLKLQKD